jgi:BMFP domain-containing protein YqiC
MQKSTQENQTLIGDMLKLSGNILGNLLGARHEMKAQAKQRMDSLARQLDLVGRREFDTAFAMLAKTRTMQEELAERLNVIEAKLERFRGARSSLRQMSSTSEIKSRAKRHLPSLRKSNRGRKVR